MIAAALHNTTARDWLAVANPIKMRVSSHRKDVDLSGECIRLRGVNVHNLRDVDLDIPRNRLVAFCGVSGSGKTSLALDTLYAEGQRRYIESFSAYTRQFLERLEKPAAERIDGIPPAVAITHKDHSRSSRATIGAATEIDNYLRLLYSRIGRVFCQGCGKQVRQESPSTVAQQIDRTGAGIRFMIAAPRQIESAEQLAGVLKGLQEDGFVRVILGGTTVNLAAAAAPQMGSFPVELLIVIDRLTAGEVPRERLIDSLETAFEHGKGKCVVLSAAQGNESSSAIMQVDGRDWRRAGFSTALTCEDCQREYPSPDPRLYSYNSPLGACPECEGFGNVVDIDMDLVVPDPGKTLAEGALAPWNTPAYKHELEELLALAPDYNLPTDIPFSELSEDHLRLIHEGVPERDFGGLQGFFAWL